MKAIITLLLACALCSGAENKLGKPLTLTQPESIDKILASADQFTGKTVQVKGKITESNGQIQKMGGESLGGK